MKRSFEPPKGVTTHILKTIGSQGWEGRKALEKARDVYKEEGTGSREEGLAGALPRIQSLLKGSGTLELPVSFDLKLCQRSCDFSLNHKMESLSFKREAFSHGSGRRHPWREGHLEISLGECRPLSKAKELPSGSN